MLVGLLLMMHESPFPLQAMLRSESLARWIPRSFQTTLPAGGRGSIGSAVLGADTKLRHRRMLATLEGKRQVTASVKLQQCDWQPQQSAASRFVGSETGVEKVKRKQLQLTGPQVLSFRRTLRHVIRKRLYEKAGPSSDAESPTACTA